MYLLCAAFSPATARSNVVPVTSNNGASKNEDETSASEVSKLEAGDKVNNTDADIDTDTKSE